MKENSNKPNNIMIMGFGIIALLVISLIGISFYYFKTKEKNENMNMEEVLIALQEEEEEKKLSENAIQNRIDELKDGSVITDLGKQDLEKKKEKIIEFNKEKEESENSQTYIYNDSMEKLEDNDYNNLKTQARLYASQYNWPMMFELESNAAQKYDFRENVEAYKLLEDIGLLSNYHNAWEGQDKELLSYVQDPVLYSYAFFYKPIEFQADLIKDTTSILLYTKTEAPKLIKEEEIKPMKYNLNKYYAKPGEIKAHKLTFEIEEGLVDFILVNNYDGFIEPISIKLTDNQNNVDILTYDDFIKDRELDFIKN